MDKPQPDKTVDRDHHIERVDREITNDHAWRVAVVRNNQRKGKKFSDSAYGGKQKSLQAAIQYRDEILSKTDLYEQQIRIRTQLHRNNTSGVSGVNYTALNGYCAYWWATWTDEHGVKHSRSFSIPRYGEPQAKQLAIAEREYQLARVCAIKGSHWKDPNIQKKRKLKPK